MTRPGRRALEESGLLALHLPRKRWSWTFVSARLRASGAARRQVRLQETDFQYESPVLPSAHSFL